MLVDSFPIQDTLLPSPFLSVFCYYLLLYQSKVLFSLQLNKLILVFNKCTNNSDLIKKELVNVDKLVHVIQGPRNRIRDLLNFELEIKDFPKHYGIREHINQCYIL